MAASVSLVRRVIVPCGTAFRLRRRAPETAGIGETGMGWPTALYRDRLAVIAQLEMDLRDGHTETAGHDRRVACGTLSVLSGERPLRR